MDVKLSYVKDFELDDYFISALENSGAVGKGTGWHSCHLIAKMDKQIIAVMPLYLKGHLKDLVDQRQVYHELNQSLSF